MRDTIVPNCRLIGVSLIVSSACKLSFYANFNEIIIDTACTAERCFRVDRAQENLHYVSDIATDVIYVLDQECPTLPQTPENEMPCGLMQPIISSLESSDKDSREGTPQSPSKKFFNRSLSGPNSAGTSDSLSPGPDGPSRKSSQGSQGSNGSPKSSLTASKEDIEQDGNGEAATYKA